MSGTNFVDTSPGFEEDQMEHLESEKGYESDQGLVDAITEGTVSIPHDESYRGAQHYQEQKDVIDQVISEKQFEALNDRIATRVSLNSSRQVRFRTYVITAAMGPIRILDDKDKRGDTVVTIASGGPISIGCDPSITAGGANTAAVAGSRRVRTADELWAVTSVNATFDVQEEFD